METFKGIKFNSHDEYFKSPAGAVMTGSPVTLHVLVPRGLDAYGVTLRLWEDGQEKLLNMMRSKSFDHTPYGDMLDEYTINVSRETSGLVWYQFIVNTPVRPYYTPRDRAGNPVNILKVKPKTKPDCDHCGICASVCPMGSIDRGDPAVISGICIKCGACVKKCPKQAKYYDDEKYLYHQHELEEGFARRAEPEIF